MEIAFLDRINAASLAVQVTGLSHRHLFLNQKRQIVNLDAIALKFEGRKLDKSDYGAIIIV